MALRRMEPTANDVVVYKFFYVFYLKLNNLYIFCTILVIGRRVLDFTRHVLRETAH